MMSLTALEVTNKIHKSFDNNARKVGILDNRKIIVSRRTGNVLCDCIDIARPAGDQKTGASLATLTKHVRKNWREAKAAFDEMRRAHPAMHESFETLVDERFQATINSLPLAERRALAATIHHKESAHMEPAIEKAAVEAQQERKLFSSLVSTNLTHSKEKGAAEVTDIGRALEKFERSLSISCQPNHHEPLLEIANVAEENQKVAIEGLFSFLESQDSTDALNALAALKNVEENAHELPEEAQIWTDSEKGVRFIKNFRAACEKVVKTTEIYVEADAKSKFSENRKSFHKDELTVEGQLHDLRKVATDYYRPYLKRTTFGEAIQSRGAPNLKADLDQATIQVVLDTIAWEEQKKLTL